MWLKRWNNFLMERQTTKQERSALKIFLEKGYQSKKVFVVDSNTWIDNSERALKALQKIKTIFSEEDYKKLENIFKHREILDFRLEVTKIYKANGISTVTFKHIK